MSEKITKIIKCLVPPLLLAAIVAVYFPTLTSSYHLDDFEIIVGNNLVDARLLPLIKKYPTRWLVFLSYWICLRPSVTETLGKFFTSCNSQLVSLHLFNVILHAANAYLIYLISLPLLLPLKFRGKSEKAGLGIHLSSAAIAFFFALLPLQTMSVIYIGQRFTLLSSFFYLATLFIISRAFFGHWPKKIAVPLAVLTFVIGLFCKETIVTAPVACIVLLWIFEASPELKYLKANQKKFLPFEIFGILFLFLIIPALVFCHLNQWNLKLILGSVKSVGGIGQIDVNVEGLSRLTYFLTQPSVILLYVALFFSPSLLCVDHDIPLCTSFLSWQFLVPVFILVFCCVIFYKARHKYPLSCWGFFFFIFPLLPQSTFIPTLDLSFEHRMYLSVAGLLWMLADLLRILSDLLPKAFRYALFFAIPLILLLYSAATYQRGSVWRNELTLWSDAMKKAPMKQRVIINFASAYLSATGDFDTVINLLTENMPKWHRVNPRAFALLGSAYQLSGNKEYALNNYLSAIDCDETNPILRYNAALLYFSSDEPKEALSHLDLLLKFNPDYADGYYLRGIVNRYLERFRQAKKDFEKYILLAPHGENLEDAKKQVEILDQIRKRK